MKDTMNEIKQKIQESWTTPEKKNVIDFIQSITNNNDIHIEIKSNGTHVYAIDDMKLVYLGLGNFE